MNALAVLEETRHLGLRLSARGDKLYVEPVPPPAVILKLKAAKAELLRALRLEAAAAEACRGLTGYITPAVLLSELAPEDVRELEACADPLPFLRSMAVALVWTAFREDGVSPPNWTSPAYCDKCGPVYLWHSTQCKSCPWCWNRLHGVKIPRPARTRRKNGRL